LFGAGLPGRRYRKSVYELVREAALSLGRGGRVFSDAEVIRYIRVKYPDCPYSDNSFRMHLLGLSINNRHTPGSGLVSTKELSSYRSAATSSD